MQHCYKLAYSKLQLARQQLYADRILSCPLLDYEKACTLALMQSSVYAMALTCSWYTSTQSSKLHTARPPSHMLREMQLHMHTPTYVYVRTYLFMLRRRM